MRLVSSLIVFALLIPNISAAASVSPTLVAYIQPKRAKLRVVKKTVKKPVVASKASYIQYTPSVLKDGKTKVLFFNASWCPNCAMSNTRLKKLYASGGASLTTYSVDYDTYYEMEAQYGFIFPNVFVKVDGNGKKIAGFEAPSDAQLKGLLK